MVWSPGAVSVDFRDVPHCIVFPCYSSYILIHFRPSTQKLNTNLNNLFYMNIKSDEMLSEIDNVLQKGEFNSTMLA